MRLTWQVVAVVLGVLAAVSACYRTHIAWLIGKGQIGRDLYALDLGGRLNGDVIEMPGDAEDGSFPEAEA